jgi:ferredoxin
VLVGVLISAVGGFMFPLLLVEPFSMFWRIQNSLFRPLIVLVNNYLYDRFELVDPLKHVPAASLSIVIASVSLFAIFVLAAIWGRWFCNTLCPAGALLGLLSRLSVFKLRLGDKCVACGACAKVCKTGCIDVKNKLIDFERCVMCMDCGAACRFGAVNFSLSQRESKTDTDMEVDPSRRNFMLGMSIAVGSALLVPPAVRSVSSPEKPPIMPPGAGKVADFTSRCTACHLCVSSCPGRVIKPAVMAYGLSGMMVPKLDFSVGMCEFECVTCSNVCPSGALRPLSVEEKRLTRIGLVKYYKERCIVVTDGYDCGACAEHCPTGALAMVSWKNGLRIPQVNPDLCIGCGCCEHICPARPAKAVIVDGLAVQEKAVKPKGKAESRTGNLDFPF